MQDLQDENTGFLEELKRRRVVRVALGYVGASFVLLQGMDLVLQALLTAEDSERFFRLLVLLVLLGFPVALLLGWLLELTPEGLRLTARRGKVGPLVARFRPRLLLAGLGALALIGTLLFLSLRAPRSAVAEVHPGADLIAVLPFSTTGNEVADLEQGMVDLLSRNLDQVGGIRTVDPRTVLHRWERRASSGRLPLEDALGIARETSAASVLTGSVVAVGSGVRISADLYSIDGVQLATVQVDGSLSEILPLVDSLSLALLRTIWNSEQPVPSLDVGAITSGNLEAIRAFLAGERFYRASAWDSAAVAFSRALTADSVFPLAHLRLASTAGWLGREQLASRHATRAREHLLRLPEREQTLVRASELRNSGHRAEAIDTMSRYVERYPDDPEGWFLLADDLYHLRVELGPPGNDTESPLWLFDRALALDPGYIPALLHPLALAFRKRDLTLLDRYLAMLEHSTGVDSTGVRIYHTAREALGEAPRPATLIRALAAAVAAERGSMNFRRQAGAAVYAPLMRELLNWPKSERMEVMERLPEEVRSRFPDSDSKPAMAALLQATGRLDEAATLLNDPTLRSRLGQDNLRYFALAPVLAGVAPTTSLENTRAELHPLDTSAIALVQALEKQDSAALKLALQRMTPTTKEGAEVTGVLRQVGEGFLRVMRGDTVTGLRAVESALEDVQLSRSASIRLVGVYLDALWFRWGSWMAAHPETRPRAIELLSQPWPGDQPLYEPLRNYLLGQALEAENRRQEAHQAYQRFLHALADADPGLPVQTKIRAAEEALGRLSKSRSGSGS